MAETEPRGIWQRFGWPAGLVFIAALIADLVATSGIPINQNDSPAKIATELGEHTTRLVVVACVCVVYAAAFLVYAWRLFCHLRNGSPERRSVATLVLVGAVLMVACHALSDVAITGLLGGKVASYAATNDPGLAYMLYLLTFAISSLGDVFGSVFMLAAGDLVLRSRLLPRWLGYVAVVSAVGLFVQGFGLGGVIGDFGLVFDLIGFGLFMLFVLASSITMLRHDRRLAASSG
jgi:hypothetical protein